MARGPALIAGQIVFPLTHTSTTLGRTDLAEKIYPDIDLAPLAGGLVVSRRHARIDRRNDGFYLFDLDSRSGTLVNGELLARDRKLNEGDALTIGELTLRFSTTCDWPDGLVAEWDGTNESSSSTQLPMGLPMITQLPNALKARDVALHYQPQVSLATGEIGSVEALIRWNHPEMGSIAPQRYLTLAEDSGFIRVLTNFALQEATSAVRAWRQGGASISVSVNISVLDLEDVTFVERARETVRGGGVQPNDFILEVTEGGVMLNPGVAFAALEHLRATGFSISIDDFGTGQSSLAYLQNLPADEVKLDRQFCVDPTDKERSIVRSTIEMAHALGVSVVAEGVEDEDTARFLAQNGCDKAQGYFFGAPVQQNELDLRRKEMPGLQGL